MPLPGFGPRYVLIVGIYLDTSDTPRRAEDEEETSKTSRGARRPLVALCLTKASGTPNGTGVDQPAEKRGKSDRMDGQPP